MQHQEQALRLPFYQELLAIEQVRIRNIDTVKLWIYIFIWLLLVLAAARPQWLGTIVELPISGRDLLLAVDISGSMQEQDYRLGSHNVSRLEIVKIVAGQFIERRIGDRLGLILFGTRAYMQTPLTFDRATVKTLLNDAVIGLAGEKTAIGDAIALTVKRVRTSDQKHKVLILLTDGTNTAGAIDPKQAAKLAKQIGLRIYTIGIGGGAVGVQTPFGILMQRPSDLDPHTLEEIAKITGGSAFQATDTAELESVYAELDRLEPSIRDMRSFRPMQALFMWPAGLALLLIFGLALVAIIPALMRSTQEYTASTINEGEHSAI